jgi:lipopolysaccharide/colanic/teichoic acid biosynthesis glycosyltransferase
VHSPVPDSPRRSGTFYLRHGKRLLDVCVALPGLAIFLPLLMGIAVLIRLRLGSPVLFRQLRSGKNGIPFVLLKFRSMVDLRGCRQATDADRLTDLGRVLRTSSADELPELWNVLKGDMSLVGPRPLLMEYLDRYSGQQARRHEVRPGITGWAQVNGRNSLSWEEKFRLDVWYVDNCSFTLDMKILGVTAWHVVARRGINEPGQATAQEFIGSPR